VHGSSDWSILRSAGRVCCGFAVRVHVDFFCLEIVTVLVMLFSDGLVLFVVCCLFACFVSRLLGMFVPKGIIRNGISIVAEL
jgi:hypothetical protein